MEPAAHYTVLAGGTGAAKFLRGLTSIVPQERVHVVVNVGDDTEVWGLHVSPDLDTILYALSDRLDTERGWGQHDETFRCLRSMEHFGMPSWFQLGDGDLATHLTRTELLRAGRSLNQVTESLASSMGVRAKILPATNDRLRTHIATPGGMLSFQEFFVRDRWTPEVRNVLYAGSNEARPCPGVLQSIRDAKLIIAAPSNPITSIGPILAVPGIRDALRCARAPVVAISPMIGNSAVSGPAAKLMQACGYDASAGGVLRCYHDVLDDIVIHTSDAAMAPSLRYQTIGVHVTDILMPDAGRARQLAAFVMRLALEN